MRQDERQIGAEHYRVTTELLKCKLTESVSVMSQVDRMLNLFEELVKLGLEMILQVCVEIIIISLPSSFS